MQELEQHIHAYMAQQLRMASDLSRVSQRLTLLLQELPARGINLNEVLSSMHTMGCLLSDERTEQLADELRWMSMH